MAATLYRVQTRTDAIEGYDDVLISSGIMCWCTRTQSYRIGERPGEGLGHRAGPLR